LYRGYFPNRQFPSVKTFTAVHNRLHATGTFNVSMADTGAAESVRTVEFEEEVLRKFDENPRTSTRAEGNEMGAGKDTVRRVLNGEKFYPYHLQKVHALEPQDYSGRVDCSRWFLDKLTDDPDFLKSVLFTD
jgi:outer membrane usher protein FimD/PapC